jgi:hypothetical protein
MTAFMSDGGEFRIAISDTDAEARKLYLQLVPHSLADVSMSRATYEFALVSLCFTLNILERGDMSLRF